jgi:hypothetical protein
MVGKHRNILFDLYGKEFDFRYLNQGKWWRNQQFSDDENVNSDDSILTKKENFVKENNHLYRCRLLLAILFAAT